MQSSGIVLTTALPRRLVIKPGDTSWWRDLGRAGVQEPARGGRQRAATKPLKLNAPFEEDKGRKDLDRVPGNRLRLLVRVYGKQGCHIGLEVPELLAKPAAGLTARSPEGDQ